MCSKHTAMIIHMPEMKGVMNAGRHISVKIPSGTTVRGNGGAAGEGKLVSVAKFHSWDKCTCNKYSVSLDVKCFLWSVHYLFACTTWTL